MPFSISLSPAKVELSLRPNQNATKAYDVTNDTDNPLTLELSILRWQPSGYDGSIQFTSEPGPFRFQIVNANLRGQTQITIGPKQKQQIVLGIEPTEKDLVGEYYYTVLFGQKNEQKTLVTTTQSSGQIGSQLILNTGLPSPDKTVNIQSFSAPIIVDSFFGSIPITGLVQNTSNHYLSFIGELSVTKNGQSYSQLYLSKDTILAQHARSLRCLDNPQSKDPIPVTCTIFSPLMPGKYKILLTPGSTITATGPTEITVYVLPLTLLVVFGLLGLIYLVYNRLTLLRKK